MVPESGRSVPEATFIRVDLPAPFSPRSACISPARTSNETSCSAATLAKLFEIFERIKGERDIYAPFFFWLLHVIKKESDWLLGVANLIPFPHLHYFLVSLVSLQLRLAIA